MILVYQRYTQDQTMIYFIRFTIDIHERRKLWH
nr:MAG TPA: hypothetical protein [Caudoviricetes sp.]DAR67512.1 MAG TPA: hypothetical protein [Caudoviricetes sp.]